MKKITVIPVDERIELVDDKGNVLCKIEHDTSPDDAMMKVASSICKAAGIEFDSAGWGCDVPGPSKEEQIQNICRYAEDASSLISVGKLVGLTEEDFKT